MRRESVKAVAEETKGMRRWPAGMVSREGGVGGCWGSGCWVSMGVLSVEGGSGEGKKLLVVGLVVGPGSQPIRVHGDELVIALGGGALKLPVDGARPAAGLVGEVGVPGERLCVLGGHDGDSG